MKAYRAEVHLDLHDDAGPEDVRRFLEAAVQNYINLRQPSPDRVKPDATGVVVSNVRRCW